MGSFAGRRDGFQRPEGSTRIRMVTRYEEDEAVCMTQFSLNRNLLCRLIDRYLLTEIQFLQYRSAKTPGATVDFNLDIANQQGELDALRSQLEKTKDAGG